MEPLMPVKKLYFYYTREVYIYILFIMKFKVFGFYEN